MSSAADAAADASRSAGSDPCEKAGSDVGDLSAGEGVKPAAQEGSESGKSVESSKKEAGEKPDAEPALPPLSAHEFKQYNRLAEHMDYFVCFCRICPNLSLRSIMSMRASCS